MRNKAIRTAVKAAKGRAPRRKTAILTHVSVTFRHVEPSTALQNYAERKLGHIGRFVKRETDVHLILEVDKYRQRGEVTVKSGRLAVNAQQETKDLYSVIDLVADKVERQLKCRLDRIEDRKVKALPTGQLLSRAEQG